jgi:lipopolysaccharide export system permease protein
MAFRHPTLVRKLDGYVFVEFLKIFMTTALGFPVLMIVIDLTENLSKFLNRNLPPSQIALSYLYWLPESMYMVLPAAVLFATVFSIGTFTRHAEITAAKASGISFFRLTLPIFFGATLAAGADLVLVELVPSTNKHRSELLQERKFKPGTDRFNFAFAGDRGRVYKVASLAADRSTVEAIEIERRGRGPAYPTYVVTAAAASWTPRGGWTLREGTMHVVPDTLRTITFAFDSLRDHAFAESPSDLLAAPKDPQNMGFLELGRFIAALERSGGDANELRVERALKIAIPVTCIIIALFGAPLATSTQRGGAAFGVGISLATTVVFLVLIQLTKAVGGKGVVTPDVAAWVPNILFGLVGLGMLSRVRT